MFKLRSSITGLVALVLTFTPSFASASPLLYAEGVNKSDIYAVNADGSSYSFVTGLSVPSGLAIDSSANLYTANGSWTMIKITPDGSYSNYVTGSVLIHGPEGMSFDSSGNLYSGNPSNGTIAKIIPPGGSGSISQFVSGLNFPWSMACDSSNNLYVGSSNAGLIYKITPGGSYSTFASGFTNPGSLAFDNSGNLYVAVGHEIDMITPDKTVSTYVQGFSLALGGLAFDHSGNLYVGYGGNSIDIITPDRAVNTFATGLDGAEWIVATPEPASITLLASAAGLLLRRRSRAIR